MADQLPHDDELGANKQLPAGSILVSKLDTDHDHDKEPRLEPAAAETQLPEKDTRNPAEIAASIVRRWRAEDMIKKSSLVLRLSSLFFSFLSFVIMSANKHGDWKNYDNYEEYRYCVGVGVVAFLYSFFQVCCNVVKLAGFDIDQLLLGNWIPRRPPTAYVDFVGDQIIAYLLISATSAAIPLTNRMREGADNTFTDTSSASIAMLFFAFLAVSLSTLSSGFQLCKQYYL